MPTKIRVLTEQTINQIAAGEVIENPSSVVKELVENSIDAGATDICIEIKGGGRQLIRITDNGCGMSKDDAVLSLERHATSKIKDVEDIHSLMTMGFRGEAVPSIASISKFSILTCEQGADCGTFVSVDGGQLLECSPAPRSPGTTIEVKSLFFNVPVRKKFQKSPTHDVNEILKMLTTIALGHPHIKFELISNQEKLLTAYEPHGSTFQEKLGSRISSILGSDFFSSLVSIEAQTEDFQLNGFIGLPGFTKQNRTGQYLFINQRGVQSQLVSFSVRNGYGTMLAQARHPVYVLHLTIPGDLVDVNVHPQKKEVRLRQEQILKDLITRSVENAFQSSGISAPEEPSYNPLAFNPHALFETKFTFEPFEHEPSVLPALPDTRTKPGQSSRASKEEIQPVFFKTPVIPVHPNLKIQTTIDGYILIEAASFCQLKKAPFATENVSFGLVDQRAAHSRIIFEKLLNTKLLALQTLLIPHVYETTPLEAAFIIEQLDFLNSLGIRIHQSGAQAFIIDALPEVFGNTDIHALITDIVHQMRDFHELNPLEKEKERRLSIAASRAAIARNRRLSLGEAESLLNQLMDCAHPFQCPKGKPTMAPILTDQLAKHFLR